MADIVIKITDSIDKNVPDKLSLIDKFASQAEQSIKRLKDALDFTKSGSLKEYAQLLTQVVIQQSAMSKSSIDLALKTEKLAQSVEKTKKSQADALSANQKLAQEYSKAGIQNQKLANEIVKTELATTKLSISQAKLNAELSKTAKYATDAQIAVVRLAQAKNKLAFDTATLNDRIAQSAIRTKIMQEQLTQASFRTRDWSARTQELSDKNKALTAVLNSVSVAYRLFIGSVIINKVTDLVDSYTLMENRLKLVSVSLDNTTALQKELFKNAQETRVPIVDLTQSFVRYDFALKSLGASQKESLTFTRTLSELLQISGLNTQEASSALLQLSQALNKGKLDGDEFRTVMETLPTLAEAIAKEMGVARGELLKLAPDGKITSQIIRQALASIATETSDRFKELDKTISQGFVTIKNGSIEFIGDINKATGASKILAESLIFIGNHIKEVFAVSVGFASFALIKYTASAITANAITRTFGITTVITNKAVTAFNTSLEFLRNTSVTSAAGMAVLGGSIAALTTYILLNKDSQELLNSNGAVLNDTFKAIGQTFKETELYAVLASIGLKGITDSFLDIRQFEPTNVLNNTILLLAAMADINPFQTTFFDDLVAKQEEITNARLKAIAVQKQQIEQTRQEAVVDQALAEAKRLNLDEKKKTGTEAEKLQAELQATADVYDKALDNLKKSFTDYVGAYSENNEHIIALEQSKARALQFILDGGNKGKKEREKEEADLLKKQEDILNSLNGTTKDYILTKQALDGLISKGLIEWEQYNDILNNTALAQRALRLEEKLRVDNQKDDFEKRKEQKRIEADFLKKENEAVKSIIKPEVYSVNISLINANLKKALDEIDAEKNKADNKEAERQDKALNRILRGYEKDLKEFTKLINDKLELLEKSAQREQKLQESFQRKEVSLSNSPNQIQNLFEEQKARKALIDEQMIKEQTDIKGHYDAKAAITKAGEDRLAKLRELQQKKDAEGRLKIASMELGATSDLFSALGTLIKNREGESTKNAKRMFKISQALALAQATVNMAVAISEANKGSIYEKIAAISFAAITGATQIAAVKSASLQGLARGGTVGGTGSTTSDSNLVYLSKGEEVIRESVARPNRAFLKDLNDGKVNTSNFNRTFNNSGDSGSKPIINIYNYSADSEATVEHSVVDGQDKFDVYVRKIEEKLAKNVSNGDGSLHGVIKGMTSRGF